MKLGIYGGTFSPIHNAHVNVAKVFYEQFSLDKLMVIPAGVPPHKQMNVKIDPEHRMKMCKLAFEDCDGIEVSDIELKREGKSYTVMTLRELTVKDRELYFLCGTDMLLTFDRWFCFEEIFKLCTLVCVRREYDCAAFDDKINEYKTKYGAHIEVLNVKPLEISSTVIREKIKSGEDVSDMIPMDVYTYIKQNGLYGG